MALEIDQRAVGATFALTAAESRLAASLAGGATLNEVSKKLRISRNTGHAQLKSIFAKVGVHRRADLVRLLLPFSPAPPVWGDTRASAGGRIDTHRPTTSPTWLMCNSRRFAILLWQEKTQTGDANMNKDVILFTAAAVGLVTAAHAASSETADTADDAAFDVHVALWRSFDVPRAAKGTQPFVRSAHGKFKIIDDPSSTSSPPATMPNAINDWGVIVGNWYDANGNYHGFVRQVDGSYTTVAGQQSTFPYAINDLDEFTGFWFDAGGAEHGFVALAVR